MVDGIAPERERQGAGMSRMVGSALRMMLGTLASRVLGLLREILTASFFGATRSLDAFYVAYTLANLSRQLLAEGALSASFVPAFARVHKRDGADAALRLARQVMTILTVACSLVVLAGMLVSPLLVRLIAPGFTGEQAVLAGAITRVLFPFLLLVSVGALAMGVLNSIGSFFVPAIAPAASNLAFIIILLAFWEGGAIWVLPAAVLTGGACSMAIQWAWAGKMGMCLIPARPDLANRDLRETLALFLPYAAGLSLNQINPVISRVLGSFLEGGVISVLNYADRIIQLPLGLFVIAISQAVLPMLSRFDPDDREGFRIFMRDALRFNLFIVTPAAIGLVMASRPIVHLLLVRGAFGEWAWEAASGALACYAAGLPGTACNTVLMRALYARRMPKAAMLVTLFTVCANLTLGAVLMRFISYRGLAIGTSCAFTGAAFLGGWLVSRSLGVKFGLFDIRWAARFSSSCLLMAGSIALAQSAVPYPDGAAFFLRFCWLFALVLGAALIYTGLTVLFRCPEWAWVKGAFGKKRDLKTGVPE
ncbi:MAG: murein biosynthesis integral membrane protein MurJ [Synergistaceae bacterium]|jgi:putative peptidoglycan lipid II flippase|nr:murein biosynthesis integral membrane protein MurJ [Synergistaceae bacterium]